MNQETLTCDICKQTQPIEMFTVSWGNNRYSSNRNNRCKACNAEVAREWRKKNPGYRGSGKIKSIPPEDRMLASAISARVSDAKSRASKRGQPCDVDREYLYQLFKDQDRKCALTGVDLKVEKKAITCLSLDQIDPAKGYIKGNVQWVAWAVNRAKGDMHTDVFVDMCKKVLEHQKVQRLSKGAA